jgi:dipeptide/tripeptide permease
VRVRAAAPCVRALAERPVRARACSVGTSGLQAILAMYFNDRLHFSDSTATFWVAVYIACYNVFGVVGGVAADGYWGKYAVQVYTTVIWTAGVLLVLPTALSGVSLSHGLQLALAFGGLGLASVGIGAQQPVQSAFVGDQITRENREHVAWYFTWYYFFGNGWGARERDGTGRGGALTRRAQWAT